MRIKRIIGFISLLLVIIIAYSAYGPWDFLGLYKNVSLADELLVDKAEVSISGQVYHKEIKNDKPIYYLRNASISSGSYILSNTSFILYLDSDEIPNYSLIKAKGSVELFESARNEGNFDLKDYYNSLGLVCKIQNTKVISYSVNPLFRHDYLYRLRKRLTQVYLDNLPGEEAGFLSSVTVGDKSNLEGELKDLFQEVGVAHVLAVSGLHVSFICMGVYGLLRGRGISFLSSSFASGIIAVLYGIMTGGSVSSKRAIGMFLIYLLSQILGETYDMLTSLSILSVILLFSNPLFIKNPSFIFSFSAVLGLTLFAKPLCAYFALFQEDLLDRKIARVGLQAKYEVSWYKKLVDAYFSGLVFSFGITVATIPVVAFMYYEVPVYSVFINSLLIPLMPFLLGLGLLGGFTGIVFPIGGHYILMICHYIIFVFEFLSSMVSKWPFSRVITGYPKMWRVIIFYVFIALILYVLPRYVKNKRIFFIQVPMMLLSIFFIVFPARQKFEIDFLDVGQGDGIYISEEGGTKIFIDGGSTSENEVGKYRILPFLKYKGAAQINYWFVSHGDQDHISGLIEAMEDDYHIENIVLAYAARNNECFDEIKSLAEEKNINISYMKFGSHLYANKLKLTCVFPYDDLVSDDTNSLSLSIYLTYDENGDGSTDLDAFFGGDIGAEQEQKIAKDGLVKSIDILKVSHHGSKYSSDSAFLETLNPSLSVISCALENSYGHPAKEAIERLEEIGTEVFYTMKAGEITVKTDNGQMYLKKIID